MGAARGGDAYRAIRRRLLIPYRGLFGHAVRAALAAVELVPIQIRLDGARGAVTLRRHSADHHRIIIGEADCPVSLDHGREPLGEPTKVVASAFAKR